ncbi:MAG: hypothetical protein ABF537_07930 [Acetobacter sp.]|uniref:hypothetical protein n=1 Tax=Acetobacter sp. TaxID=440 RepID=UPI0039ED1484
MSITVFTFGSGITLTKEKALEIQAEQVDHYAKIYGEGVRQAVADATTADALTEGVEYDMQTVNRHIPRGAAIEALIPAKVEAERRYKEGMAQFLGGEG